VPETPHGPTSSRTLSRCALSCHQSRQSTAEIFKYDSDYQRFEALLGEMVKRHSLKLYSYVLMPNHFHLLLEVGRMPLAKAMQVLLYPYTRRYNQSYRQSGHLFQGRYKAILCDRDSYLMELIRYLHLNPVRAGRAIGPGRYRWRSHEAYVRGKSTGGIRVRSQAVTLEP